jgi:uncharacterized protein with beta-barrel porin domain
MTKNRFLSKRLACLLTSALITTPVLLYQNTASAQTNIAGPTAIAAGDAVARNFTADATITVTAGANLTLSGAYTTATTNTGTIIVLSTDDDSAPDQVSFSGDVGTSDKKIKAISIGSATRGGKALFTNDVFATTITVTGGDAAALDNSVIFNSDVTANIALVEATAGSTTTLKFDGANDQVITGNITATNTFGTLQNTNTDGFVQIQGTVGADGARLFNISLDEDSTTVVNGALFANFGTIDGNLILTSSGNAGTGDWVLGEFSSLILGRDHATTSTALTIDGDFTITAGAKIYPSLSLLNGNTQNIVITGTDPATGDFDATLQDNALFTYAGTEPVAGTHRITATARTTSAVATQLGVSTNVATAYIEAHKSAVAAAAANINDTALDAFEMVTSLFDKGGIALTETGDTNFAKQLAPQTDLITGSTVAAKAVTSGVQNVIATRLASLRSGDAYSTGVVTGSHMGANSGFVQAFGSKVDQKNKGNEFGYDADTAGFAIGFDTKVPGGAVMGISYAHSDADVEGKGTGRAKNDIKTNSVSLYADYATKDGYVEGSITYGKSDNKGSRIINTAEMDLTTYKSDYDSEQYSFRLFGGIPQSLGGGAFLTPFAGATISQIKADAYTETSTTTDDALRLRVAQDTVDSQVGTIGIKYHQVIKDGKTTFTPEVKLALNNEFGDGNITTTNTYQGGGASFKNSTAIEKTSATAGVGLNISSDNVSFNIGYEADVKEKYLGHSAQAKITAKF